MTLGSREVAKAYLGDALVYQNTPPVPPVPTEGVYILYTDGTTSNYDTLVSGKTPVGVVLISGDVSIVIHPDEGLSKNWSSNTSTAIPGVTTTTDENAAKADYAGEENSAAVLASGLAGTAFSFADDRGGYLPSCGEMDQIRLNVTNINTALALIGGTQLDFASRDYWSSTQCRGSNAWYWFYYYNKWLNDYKFNNFYCRSVSAF